MKKLIITVIVVLPLLSGCGEGLKQIESDYQIKVTGTPGVNFKGNYTFPGTSGLLNPVQVNGAVPAEYKGKGITAICLFRKADANGTLKVEILNGEKVINSMETSEPFGVISMNKMPNKDGVVNLIISRILDLLKI